MTSTKGLVRPCARPPAHQSRHSGRIGIGAATARVAEGAEPLDAAAIGEFATGRLAHYKIPRYVMIVDEFSMTVTGKVRKVEMRAESTRILGLV